MYENFVGTQEAVHIREMSIWGGSAVIIIINEKTVATPNVRAILGHGM